MDPDDPRQAPVHEAAWDALDPCTAYALAALRCAVFVVEQQCCYLDLDGRDLEPGTRHLWIAGAATTAAGPADPGTGPAGPAGPGGTAAPGGTGGTVRAALRLLVEPDGGHRIGRVVTDPAHRGLGLAARLMTAALQRPGPFVLDAQSHLTQWYERFGFSPDGAEFVEDGIPHTPMRRP